MKALLTSFLFAFCFAMPAGAYSTVDAQGRMVYICVRDRAYAYHSTPNCRALKKCQGHIKKVTIEEAFRLDRRKPCGWCCK